MYPTTTPPLSRWYCGSGPQSSPADFDAKRAFDEAVQIFKTTGTKDARKSTALDNVQASTIHDVLAAINSAGEAYKSRRASSSARTCLVEISKRVSYYGTVMDALVQQHPEYVSLAWGTMKLVFGAVVENERLGTTIATGLCKVADALPRTELALELYPTETMREAAVKLYTLILRFLTRALKWYEEGRLRHAMHAVFKPAALQYDDILAQIRQVSRSISDRAAASGQAEQRDMHDKLRNVESTATVEFNEIRSRQRDTHSKLESNADVVALTALIHDLRDTILTSQAAHASERIQLRNALCDLQLSQLLGALSTSLTFDHLETLHQVRKLRGRRPGQGSRGAMRLQTYAAYNDWSTSSVASILRMRSTFKDRNSWQEAITQIIEYLRQAKVGVLWALKSGYQTYEMSEVLKSLVYQALAVYHSTDIDAAASLKSRKVFSACFEEDYVELLDDVLQSFRLVYIIVESPVVSSEASARFQKHLGDLVEKSRLRAPMGRLKVLVVIYGPVTAISQGEDVVLKLERLKRSKGRQTKSKAALGYKGRRSGRMSGADDGIRLD